MAEAQAQQAVLAFDFGLRAIGVAAGHSPSGACRALQPVPARDGAPDWERIQALVADWEPQTLLVGLPLNMDGSESDMSRRSRRFARQLQARFSLQCELIDERLTSVEAARELKSGHRARDRHGAAARLIFNDWLRQAAPAQA